MDTSRLSRMLSTSDSCDEDDLVCALECLEATANIELSENHSNIQLIRPTSSLSQEARPLAEELWTAERENRSATSPEGGDGSLSPSYLRHTPAFPERQERRVVAADSLGLRGEEMSETRERAAEIIQQAWRRHQSYGAGSSDERVNPFSQPRELSVIRLSSESAGQTDLDDVSDDAAAASSADDLSPSQDLDPTYHIATVAAQLCTLESHERHVLEITQDVPTSDEEDEGEDEDAMSSEYRAKLLAPSMQICFTPRHATELTPQLPTSGRESRGSADGASSGSPVGTDDELRDVQKPVKVRRATKTASSNSVVSRQSVEGASDSTLPTRSSSPEHTSPASTLVSRQPSNGRQRADQVFDGRLLSQLSIMHLKSLTEEFEHEVQVISNELIEQLTERDALVATREEYNRLFRQCSKMKKEPVYDEDSAMHWPASFQPPAQTSKPTKQGLLERTRKAFQSKGV